MEIIKRIEKDEGMKVLWMNYQNKFDYAENYDWQIVIHLIKDLYMRKLYRFLVYYVF